jgi:hypothetical protein
MGADATVAGSSSLPPITFAPFCRAVGFDAVRRVEVVALREHLEREVREDLAGALGLSRVVFVTSEQGSGWIPEHNLDRQG